MLNVESSASTLKNMIFNKKFIIILFVVTIFIAVAFFVSQYSPNQSNITNQILSCQAI